MAAIKAAVGIAVDIAGSVIRVSMVSALAVGITAVVMFGPSGTALADASTDTFLLGVISAVMLLGMLIAGCVAFVSQRHTASHQQGNDYARQQAFPATSGSIHVGCGIAMPHAADDIGGQRIADVSESKHGCVGALHRMENRG